METVVRVTVIFVFLAVALRIIGKRELGELSPFELLLIMIIPEIVSQGLTKDDYSVTNALVGVSTLLSLVVINSFLTHRFKKYRKFMEGDPVLLFFRGEFLKENMNKERITPDEIISEVRGMGYLRMDQMDCVVLEPDGKISCVPKRP